VLVTGATGFVGGHLVDRLLASGATVAALARTPAKASSLIARGVEIVPGDLTDTSALARACANRDVVYHVGGTIAARNEAEFLAVNEAGTARLVAAAETAGIRRFVLVSSLSVGGPTRADRPLVGTETPNPVTAYGRSKLAGERVVRGSKLSWTIVRPPAVYGPADREMLRVFRAVALGIAPVFGNGSQQLSLVFGPDLAAALIAAASSPRTEGDIFYAAHPEVVTSRQLGSILGRATGRRPVTIPVPALMGRLFLTMTEGAARLADRATVLTRDKGNELFQPAWTCDPSRLMDLTGWRAEHDLASGAKITFDWYRRAKWL
jgi:nucleoside-diphosphate-sugar epimerase